MSFIELVSLCGGWNFFLSCQFVNSSTYGEKAEPSQKGVKFKKGKDYVGFYHT